MIRDPDYWVDASGNLRSIRKDNLAAQLETFYNENHDAQGRFTSGEQGDEAGGIKRGSKARPREPIIEGNTAKIPLTDNPNGPHAKVDISDLPKVAGSRWSVNSEGYAQAKIGGKTTIMHRVITGEKGWDHINRDPLDNRKSNLRSATSSQQGANRGMPQNNTSGYKGVGFVKDRGRWKAQIGYKDPETGQKKTKMLGHFETPEQAAHAYNRASKALFGDFAFQNNIKKEGEIHFEE